MREFITGGLLALLFIGSIVFASGIDVILDGM
jgi:hypothetical protein